jgi:UDP-glucose 4-epimerase
MRRLKIALTGARGILGGHLAPLLSRDAGCRRLILLDLVPPAKKLKKAVFYRVDLTEPTASARIADAFEREQPDVVVHLAFLQHPTRNPGYQHELESLGTMHLLHSLTQLVQSGHAPHLILGSSTLVYGARAENPNFLREDAPLAGRRDYSLVGEKIAAERQVRDFHESLNAPVTILRTAPLIAPGVRTLASRYLSLGAVPTALGFNPMMQALALEDALEAFLLAIRRTETLEQNAPAGAYNICGSGVLPLHTAIRLCGRRNLPLPAFAAAAMMDALFAAGLAISPSPNLDYLRYSCVADGERARNDLAFVPKQSSRDAVASFARTLLRDAA